MQKKLCFVLSLTILRYWTEASPVNLGTLEFDRLDTDLDDLKYEVEEENYDDFSKFLDEPDAAKSNSNLKNDKSKAKLKGSGFKKNATSSKGLKSNHNIQDLKKLFQIIGVKDQGSFNDDEIYAAVEGLIGEAVGAKGKEERKYKKGTKTKGFHRVHHKDEYKKDKEFYEDDETTGSIQKVGGKAVGYKIGGGVGFDKGHFHHDRQKGIFGKQGYLDKGFTNRDYSGYTDDQGFEGSYDNSN
ncbi:unnamed protein product [Diatraea saccharalis]|uniref:Uncharacterized protein n=1 Tax=Diatraea saccharalis TaxID=40085 RepID=A0A9N9WHU6_9NEOP|nr:unnamed protein product [Diatraea saccharalis]